jgi:isoleucyl-tRNA synthetase
MGPFLQEWETLLNLRQDVLSQLEMFRVNKNIGKSLEAAARVEAAADYFKSLKKYENSLPELLNVSAVHLTSMDLAAPGGRVMSFRGGGAYDPTVEICADPKCDRCWRHVPDVGQQEEYPTVCLRCAEALDAIDFPAYAATSTKE